MSIDERALRLRRIKRSMKAGASIALALAAGAFLACQRNVSRVPERSPMGPDARSGPPPVGDGFDAAAPLDAPADLAAPDAAEPSAPDAALAVRDAGHAARDAGLAVRDAARDRPHRVDVHEHRHGLPVIDNLLE